MQNEISIKEYIELAKNNIKKAANYEIQDDDNELAHEIYKRLFDFYENGCFSGDVIFTWKSPSLVKNGDYIGKRVGEVDNRRVIGNIFPNYCSNRKFSLNSNRNGCMGDFPHDYFDIYLDHIAQYAYNIKSPQIKEYYPLKRAILYEENMRYFKKFNSFENFLKRNYLYEIWKKAKISPYSDMEFDTFKEETTKLMNERGIIMLKKLIES